MTSEGVLFSATGWLYEPTDELRALHLKENFMKFVIVYDGVAYGPYEFENSLAADTWIQGTNIRDGEYSIYPFLEPVLKVWE